MMTDVDQSEHIRGIRNNIWTSRNTIWTPYKTKPIERTFGETMERRTEQVMDKYWTRPKGAHEVTKKEVI